MSATRSPDPYSVHSHIGALNELNLQIVTRSAQAVSYDPHDINADMAIDAIKLAREHLDDLERELSPPRSCRELDDFIRSTSTEDLEARMERRWADVKGAA